MRRDDDHFASQMCGGTRAASIRLWSVACGSRQRAHATCARDSTVRGAWVAARRVQRLESAQRLGAVAMENEARIVEVGRKRRAGRVAIDRQEIFLIAVVSRASEASRRNRMAQTARPPADQIARTGWSVLVATVTRPRAYRFEGVTRRSLVRFGSSAADVTRRCNVGKAEDQTSRWTERQCVTQWQCGEPS
jgi:hypothetical protein